MKKENVCMTPNKRISPEIRDWNGLTVHVSQPMHLRDGRLRIKISIHTTGGIKKIKIAGKSIHPKSGVDISALVDSTIQSLAVEHCVEIFDLIRTHELPNATINLYYGLCHDRVAQEKRWAGRATKYDALWERDLSGEIGNMRIVDITRQALDDVLKTIYPSRVKHHEKPEEERIAWKIMSDILDLMEKDGLITINPIHDLAAKYQKTVNSQIARIFSAKSLTVDEQHRYVEKCLAIEDESLRSALLLRFFQGLTVYEVLGLDIGACKRYETLSWVEIRQECYQKRGDAAKLITLLDSENQYRRSICTDVSAVVMLKQLKYRKAAGAQEHDPLFVDGNGNRLTPTILQEKESELLDHTMAPGLHIYKNIAGHKERQSRERSRGDVIRGTAACSMRNICKMTLPEVCFFCGIDRAYTYAQHYVDWNNRELLLYEREKLERWHHSIVRITRNGDYNAVATSGTKCQTLVLHGQAKASSGLNICCECGVTVAVSTI